MIDSAIIFRISRQSNRPVDSKHVDRSELTFAIAVLDLWSARKPYSQQFSG